MTTPEAGVLVDSANDPRGGVWRRWEPHIHTPGTAMNDSYGAATLDDFLNELESADPPIEALGITDYLLVRRYEEVLAATASGRLPNVGLIFCNIEMRLMIETKAGKGVNLHILVSPDDPNHVEEIKRHLAKLTFHFSGDDYACTPAELIRLGKAHDKSIADTEKALRAGVNQFKVDFHRLRQLYEDTEWLQANTLIAVAASSNDGTAGLQHETSGFAALREEIEAMAHIVFTATPSSITFWRGEGTLTAPELQKRYRGMKPCLHGSDAHTLDRVARPDGDRYCWIKGDATFETLRQACMEPRLRVYIGDAPPASDTSFTVSEIATPSLAWLLNAPLPINGGMVAIIGARGSGKTAIADLIAHAASSPFPSDGRESFLTRAHLLLGGAEVAATWSDGSRTTRKLTDRPTDTPEVHYLTQQFVEKLCSSVEESDELLDEIKRIVFLAHEPESRLGAENFDSLVSIRSDETNLAVEALNQRLDRLSHDVLVERSLITRLPDISRDLAKAKTELDKTEGLRRNLVAPSGTHLADYYARLSDAITEREQAIQRLSRLAQGYRTLKQEVERYAAEVFPRMQDDLRQLVLNSTLTDADWAAFLPKFGGDPSAVVTGKLADLAREIARVTAPSELRPSAQLPRPDLSTCSLESLKTERTAIGEKIGADKRNVQRLTQLNQLHATQTTTRQRLEDELTLANGARARLDAVVAERASLYQRFFELITDQCEILEDLYKPLAAKLVGATSSASKLELKVRRSIDVESWANSGEELLDLRKAGGFRGHGQLALAAQQDLLPAWLDGSAADVATAMDAFRGKYDQSFIDQSGIDPASDRYQQWIVDLGRWLYSTDHVHVRYSIEYEGVPIAQLSPGTRGIVLLLLYLALDSEDSRPLIIDQPEENLDPKSVYTELVELFREARTRRQVIIVTHNANLVVNTDVDQVIVAACSKRHDAPPEFRYLSGGLENRIIRDQVCDILEGGEDAFRERARRLRVPLKR